MKTRFSICIVLIVASLTNAFAEQFYGKFEGELVLKPLGGKDEMQLVHNYSYIDPAGGRWDAPAGTVSDGASIPSFLWPFVGHPWGADYRNAAVIHDVACKLKNRPWDSVHLAFYHAMLAAGVGETKANMMYQAVYRFGQRWKRTAVRLPASNGAAQTTTIVTPVQGTLKMTSEDYNVIKKNAELVAKAESLQPYQKLAALQLGGELNRERIVAAAHSNTALDIRKAMGPRLDPGAEQTIRQRFEMESKRPPSEVWEKLLRKEEAPGKFQNEFDRDAYINQQLKQGHALEGSSSVKDHGKEGRNQLPPPVQMHEGLNTMSPDQIRRLSKPKNINGAKGY